MVVEVIPEGLLTAKRPVSGTCFGVLGFVVLVMQEDEEVESFKDKLMRDLDTMITTKGSEKRIGGKLVAKAFFI